jgi:iron(III) transport system ATP-binding protein
MLTVNIKSFSYNKNPVLKNIEFEVKKGQHLAILGESGCGKSTLLHLIYGLLHIENGEIIWEEKKLLGPKHNLIPGEPFIKLVAQEYNVMPFITVKENIASHLSRNNPEADEKKVEELLYVVDLKEFADVLAKNLSGGQKQRVALAKALAKEPDILLLDEPFSSIDTFRKNKLRRSIFNYLKSKNITCITATHDSEEALAFADKIMILKEGEIEICDSPEKIYNNLQNKYLAGFFDEATELPTSVFCKKNTAGNEYLLPHQLIFSESRTPLQVVIKKCYFRGRDYLVVAIWNEIEVFFLHSTSLLIGSKVYLAKN